MTDFTSRPPTPHELLVEAMAHTAWETLTRDEGQWTDAIEDALTVAKRDHSAAILNLIGDVREGWYEEDPDGEWYVGVDECSTSIGRAFVVRTRGEATDA